MTTKQERASIRITELHAKAVEIDQFTSPSWGPLVKICALYGIGRTRAFELARSGLLETFHIGRSRCVYIRSVERLPQMLQCNKENAK